ncbi:MAG: sensor histidine kinase [Myxococcota bacterium]
MASVTLLARAEDELRQERARLAEAQRIAQIGSWDWDIERDVMTWSDELYRIFGRDKQSFRATYEAFLACIHAEDKAYVDSAIRSAAESGNDFRNAYRVVRDGSIRFVEGRGRVQRSSNGAVVRVIGTVQDVTEREVQHAPLRESQSFSEQRRAADELESLNEQLRALNASLTATLKEREVLLQEVHHRVKNNLQVISSLINLQMGKLEEGASRDALDVCRTRVLAIALIHEKLYQSSDYARVPFADYARSLASSVLMAAGMEPGQVHLDLDLEPLRLAVDQAIPCGLVLNELITNALKHGLKGACSGTIRVELEKLANKRARLSVTNDGEPLPSSFDAKASSSLGMHLVTALAAQLDGELTVVREPTTSFVLEFPLPEAEC